MKLLFGITEIIILKEFQQAVIDFRFFMSKHSKCWHQKWSAFVFILVAPIKTWRRIKNKGDYSTNQSNPIYTL